MLSNLTIKNIVLVEHLKIDFKSGLCALTGETGAGKSILLDSLGLTLGARSNTGLIRKGADKASVTSVFELPKTHCVFSLLENHDIETEDTLILKRTLTSEGVSKAYINDQIISLNLLRQVADMLAEVHGQFDNQKLFNVAQHIDYLDEYGNYDKDSKLTKEKWKLWQEAKQHMLMLKEKSLVIYEEEEYLRQSVHDLDALEPVAGEEKKLIDLKSMA